MTAGIDTVVPLLSAILTGEPSLDHIGILVNDLDKAIEYYRDNFGWDNLKVHEVEMKECLFRGRHIDCRLRATTAHPGATAVELFEAVDGDTATPYTEFRDRRGEGLHHIGYRIDRLDRALSRLATKGVTPLFYHRFLDRGVTFAYLNTPDLTGGTIFELIERKS